MTKMNDEIDVQIEQMKIVDSVHVQAHYGLEKKMGMLGCEWRIKPF